MPGLPTLLQEASTSSSFPFQLSARMSGRASPVPNLKGLGSQHHPSHEGRSGAATLLLRPWGSAVRGTEALWPLPGSKPWGGGRSVTPGGGGLMIMSAGAPVYAPPDLRALSAGGGEPPRAS